MTAYLLISTLFFYLEAIQNFAILLLKFRWYTLCDMLIGLVLGTWALILLVR